MKKKSKPVEKTVESSIYLEVTDDVEGQKIIDAFVKLLTESRYNPAYLNGWIGPVKNEINWQAGVLTTHAPIIIGAMARSDV